MTYLTRPSMWLMCCVCVIGCNMEVIVGLCVCVCVCVLQCHTGILGGGHYVTYAKNPNNKWYCYNDSSCKVSRPNNVCVKCPSARPSVHKKFLQFQ